MEREKGKRDNMGKEIVRKILEEKKKVWNATSLATYIKEKEGVSIRTAWKYLAYYTKDGKRANFNKIVKDGVVHIKRGKESLFYARTK